METQEKSILNVQEDELLVTMSHMFDAPRELVYRVITSPEYVPQWWGPGYLTTTVERMEVRPGGRWRFVQQAPDGTVHPFNGEYREVLPPERLSYTFEYEPMAGHDFVETIILEEQGDRTRVTITDQFKSVEDLRGMVTTGMEEGTRETVKRLTELLERLMQERR